MTREGKRKRKRQRSDNKQKGKDSVTHSAYHRPSESVVRDESKAKKMQHSKRCVVAKDSHVFSSAAQRWMGLVTAARVQCSVPPQHSEPL